MRRDASSETPPVEVQMGLVTIDLRDRLTPEELESFLTQAREAGRTPEEHFVAITLGSERPRMAAQG